MSDVLVHRVVAPDRMVGYADRIAQAMFQMRSSRDGSRALTISPISGCISYEDRSALFKATSASGLTPTPDDAKSAAEKLLADASDRLDRAFAGLQPQVLQIIPARRRHLRSRLVSGSRNGPPDHWLCRFSVGVGSGLTATDGAIWGSTACLDVRLGPANRPIGYRSTWRAIEGARPFPLLTPPSAVPDAVPLYDLYGFEDPQTHIAPYYGVQEDDEGSRFPASTVSLTVQLVLQNVSGGVRVRALTEPAGRPLLFKWGAWRVDALDAGFRSLTSDGTPDAVLITEGIHNVVADVFDSETRMLVRSQAMVYPARLQLVS